MKPLVAIFLLLPVAAPAEVPHLVNVQGRVTVSGVNHSGAGRFRFALVNQSGTTTHWRNSVDTSPADGIPDASINLDVRAGLYSVLLGDTAIPNMAALPATVFTNQDVWLRVWFDDGSHGLQRLSRISGSPPSATR